MQECIDLSIFSLSVYQPSWVRVLEYADGILQKSKTPSPTSVLYITLNNLMMKLQPYSFV